MMKRGVGGGGNEKWWEKKKGGGQSDPSLSICSHSRTHANFWTSITLQHPFRNLLPFLWCFILKHFSDLAEISKSLFSSCSRIKHKCHSCLSIKLQHSTIFLMSNVSAHVTIAKQFRACFTNQIKFVACSGIKWCQSSLRFQHERNFKHILVTNFSANWIFTFHVSASTSNIYHNSEIGFPHVAHIFWSRQTQMTLLFQHQSYFDHVSASN